MATARALRLVASSPSTTQRSIVAVHRRLALLSTTTEAAGAGDPAVHSGEPPSEDYAERPPKFSGAEEATAGAADNKHPSRPTESSASTTAKERVPPFGPSGKLGSQEPADPAAGSTFTQKRQLSSSDRAPAGSDPLGDATPGDEEAATRKVREEDREYYRTRKPSPLAEVEFADTRKPLTRHTDGSADDRVENDVPGAMVRDTADASLARAEAMFREAASRGNPAWPHSRALAAMLARRGGEGDAGAGGNRAVGQLTRAVGR